MSKAKSAGPNGLAADSRSSSVDTLEKFTIKRITGLADNIYDEGKFPAGMMRSAFIRLFYPPEAAWNHRVQTILENELDESIDRVDTAFC